MQLHTDLVHRTRAFLAGVILTLLASAAAAAPPCVVPDNGTGTVDLPPAGCEYPGETAGDLYVITDGLPAGATIEMVPIHKNWICGLPLGTCTILPPFGVCELPGGSLGGTASCAGAVVEFQVSGTGSLAGFLRTLAVQLDWEQHDAPRLPGDPVQSFPSRLFRMQGELFGDPDFCTYRIRAGDQLGLPSSGQTVLTDLGDGTFNVDSFFDVTYEVEFQGCPGSPLEGMAGTTQGTLRIRTGETLGSSTSVPAISAPLLAALGSGLLLLGAWMARKRAESR